MGGSTCRGAGVAGVQRSPFSMSCVGKVRSLGDLPPELIDEVLVLLLESGSLKDLFHCWNVCRSWRQAVYRVISLIGKKQLNISETFLTAKPLGSETVETIINQLFQNVEKEL